MVPNACSEMGKLLKMGSLIAMEGVSDLFY